MHEEGRAMGGGFVGIDVSKDRLDVGFRPGGDDLEVTNDHAVSADWRGCFRNRSPSWWC